MTKNIKKHIALSALCLGFFIVIMDVTIVNVALPDMAKKLHGGLAWLQWVVDGYTLTFAGLLLSVGSLSDRFGAKTIFIWGLILFAATSLACAVAPTFQLLVFFRLLQGIAAAFLVPTSLSLIHAAYEDRQERARAIGVWAAAGGLAAVTGPIVGGILTFWFGWPAVFFVNIPLGILAVLLAQYVQRSPHHSPSPFDLSGQLTAIISIGALAFSLIEAGRSGWFSVIVITSFIIFILFFIAFLIIERRNIAPMLPLTFFKSSTFSTAIAIGMILNISFYGELFVLSLYFQQIREYSTILTGFAFLPLLGVVAGASYFGGKMTSATGSKFPMAIGLAMGAIGFICMLITTTQTPYVMLILPLAAIGFGTAFAMPAATMAAIHAAPKGRAGIASGALNSSRQLGSLIGVAIFGTIINASNYFVLGMHGTVVISAVIYLCGSIAAVVYVK